MAAQLRDVYLKNSTSRYGLYSVGMFYCDQWDDTDPRRHACPRETIEDARLKFSAQANKLSTAGYTIQSYVLDVRAS
jgi:hypothetical protein